MLAVLPQLNVPSRSVWTEGVEIHGPQPRAFDPAIGCVDERAAATTLIDSGPIPGQALLAYRQGFPKCLGRIEAQEQEDSGYRCDPRTALGAIGVVARVIARWRWRCGG